MSSLLHRSRFPHLFSYATRRSLAVLAKIGTASENVASEHLHFRQPRETLKNGLPAHFQHAKRKRGFRFASFSATYVAENSGASCPAREALINQRFPRPLKTAERLALRGKRGLIGFSSTWVLATLVLMLQGCAIVPGYDVYTLRTQGKSSLELPVNTPSGVVPARVRVQKIDAEMIIAIAAEEERRQDALAFAEAPPANFDYRLGPGDIINIVVWGHPDLTIPSGEFRTAEEAGTVVSEQGTIFFPYAGLVKVEGLTLQQVRARLTQELSRVIENVQLEVRMAAFRSKRVYMTGEVNSPGVYNITDIPMTMVEAISQAGGFTDNADQSKVVLNRDGQLTEIDMLALYEDGDMSQNVLLQDGDVVNVFDNAENRVYVMGAVGNRTLPIEKGRLTMAQAISGAGNIREATANPYEFFVVRGGDTPEIFHLSAKQPDALLLAEGFPLKPKDIVYVDTADLVRWNRFISLLLPTRREFGIDDPIIE